MSPESQTVVKIEDHNTTPIDNTTIALAEGKPVVPLLLFENEAESRWWRGIGC
jgi:hypothetical protein